MSSENIPATEAQLAPFKAQVENIVNSLDALSQEAEYPRHLATARVDFHITLVDNKVEIDQKVTLDLAHDKYDQALSIRGIVLRAIFTEHVKRIDAQFQVAR